MDEFDLSSLIAECEVYLRCFGIDPRSPLLPRILQRYGLPQSFRDLEPMDLVILRDTLRSDWEAIPIEIRNARSQVQLAMTHLRLSWAHPSITGWASKRGVKLSQLTLEDLQDLHQRLVSVASKIV